MRAFKTIIYKGKDSGMKNDDTSLNIVEIA
jgi:hypothetical protein